MKHRLIFFTAISVVGIASTLAGFAQMPQMNRLGGPSVYNYGYRPFNVFNNGQYGGLSYYGPFVLVSPEGYPVAQYSLSYPQAAPWQTYAIESAGEVGEAGSFAIARTNDAVDIAYEKDGTLVARWDGQPAAVRSIAFTLLGPDRKVIKSASVTALPAEARFESAAAAQQLAVRVEFVNGTSLSVTTALAPPKLDTAKDNKAAAADKPGNGGTGAENKPAEKAKDRAK